VNDRAFTIWQNYPCFSLCFSLCFSFIFEQESPLQQLAPLATSPFEASAQQSAPQQLSPQHPSLSAWFFSPWFFAHESPQQQPSVFACSPCL
jgi:hypothetical protein